MRVGIDSYAILPLGKTPLDVLRWAVDHGAEGVQFSGLNAEEMRLVDDAYLQDMARFAADQDLYLEWGGGQHIPLDLQNGREKDIWEPNRRAAAQAARLGVRVVRSCSGGLMRWRKDSPDTATFLRVMAAALRDQRAMLQDYGVVLAIETHFEFTTFELLRLFDMCEAHPGEWLGVCLDTMNLLTMLEDPLTATRRILPWVVSTHIKDGGILLTGDGLTTFPAQVGEGIVDLRGIIGLLADRSDRIHLSIEDHGGEFHLPIFDERFRAEFPDLTLEEFMALCRLTFLSAQRMGEGTLKMTSRQEWPQICEERIKRDIAAMRTITAGNV
jgi:sugar phosphate isomerase/epimerase